MDAPYIKNASHKFYTTFSPDTQPSFGFSDSQDKERFEGVYIN